MNKSLTNGERIEVNRQYFKQLIKQIKPRAYTLNLKLVNNPFLKNQDKFHYILYQLNQYNKRVQKKQVSDAYQMLSYQKLHSMISDLAQFETKKDQIQALHQVNQWYKQQSRLISQRRDQGQIRYQMTKDYHNYTLLPPRQVATQVPQQSSQQIPSQLMNRILQPYRWGNRLTHKQLDIPLRRLNEYKRKVINIAPFIQAKDTQQPPRVLYPMPPKYQPKQEEQQVKEGEEEKPAETQVQPQAQGEQQGPIKDQQPEQNIPGFGEEPQQPEQQEPEQNAQDKLAPKNKLFTSAIANQALQPKSYKGQYMYYRGRQNISERSLQQRYLKLQQEILLNQRQDKVNIELATERARKKSKMVKQIQKKLQDLVHKPQFSFYQQQVPQTQRLSAIDQSKYGFSSLMRNKPKHLQVDMSSTLPRLTSSSFDQKTIRRDRLSSLKSKFTKMLNLTQFQQRQAIPSLCQYTGRRRGLSQIIRNHSKSKERIGQLDQVTRIKEKLTRNKIGINIRALSQGLCLPEGDQGNMEGLFPNKELPSNPFMVQTKKKKKKK